MFSAQGHGAVQIALTNRSSRFLSDVQMTIYVPRQDADASDEAPDADRFPIPPRRFGEPPEQLPSGSRPDAHVPSDAVYPRPVLVEEVVRWLEGEEPPGVYLEA